jgi:ubiquinone biosynthesis protein
VQTLGNLGLLLAFAWIVRGLLAAREVTWPRLLGAVVIGSLVGASIAALLLVDVTTLGDPAVVTDLPGRELLALALPFQLVAMMVTVVVFELVSARPVRRRGLRPVRPLRALRRRARIIARSLQVIRIVARHGLAPALGLRRGELPARSPLELAQRGRAALEDAGGMFVKLGQLLATRPDLVPPEVQAELGRLHAAARPLERSEAERAITAEIGVPLEEAFAEVDWTPLGSASIAQAHVARLHDGTPVVLKIRRPGLEDLVERDLAITMWLARVAERRTAWGRFYGTTALAREFADALRDELDLALEARNAIEMAAAVREIAGVKVPGIVEALTTERLLVMELLDGTTLSSLQGARDDARLLADALCSSQIRSMLQGERFHGDPHPGNVLVLTDGTLGLIDFGVTGRLDAFERASMLQMLLALQLEEPSLLFEALVAVGAIGPDREPDDIERHLARFMAANLGPGLPPMDALTELLRLTTRLGIRLPPQASTMFRALATLAGTLERLSPGYPLIDQVASFGGDELKDRMSPASIGEFVQHEWAQLAPLLRRAPRHLDRIATMLEHGGVTTRLRIFGDRGDVRVVERLVNRVVLTALALGVGTLAVLMLGTTEGPTLAGTGIRLLEVLGWTGLFAAVVLILRVLLDVLRIEAGAREDLPYR